ncbi:MAG: hypothetical protein K1X83_05295 [Oligoflexia bacterium]|nr:hypothetical protein [Oligoflexia bacterium]
MGLCADLSRADSSILGAVVARGLGAYDPLRLGLRTVHSGNLTAADGTVQRDIYTLGVLRRGDLWESTAVRELRSQAQRIASTVAHRIELEPQEVASGRELRMAASMS